MPRGVWLDPYFRRHLPIPRFSAELPAALPSDFFGTFLQGATSFFEVLREPTALLECVDALAEHFNGDVFHLTATEKYEIEKADLYPFADAFEGKTSANQRHFWALYSFADLPVEFISYLYED